MKEKNMTRKYEKEFKINAVKLYMANDESIKKIADDLGISKACLGHWIKQYKNEGEKSFPGSGHVVHEELRALKKELYLVRQERDMPLKKQSPFSQNPEGKVRFHERSCFVFSLCKNGVGFRGQSQWILPFS